MNFKCTVLNLFGEFTSSYLNLHKITLVTNHKPLTTLSTSVSKSERLTRWKLSRSEYSFDITYKPGKNNVNADVLSRVDAICAINEIRKLSFQMSTFVNNKSWIPK